MLGPISPSDCIGAVVLFQMYGINSLICLCPGLGAL